jgi:hypothetical protein
VILFPVVACEYLIIVFSCDTTYLAICVRKDDVLPVKKQSLRRICGSSLT